MNDEIEEEEVKKVKEVLEKMSGPILNGGVACFNTEEHFTIGGENPYLVSFTCYEGDVMICAKCFVELLEEMENE